MERGQTKKLRHGLTPIDTVYKKIIPNTEYGIQKLNDCSAENIAVENRAILVVEL